MQNKRIESLDKLVQFTDPVDRARIYGDNIKTRLVQAFPESNLVSCVTPTYNSSYGYAINTKTLYLLGEKVQIKRGKLANLLLGAREGLDPWVSMSVKNDIWAWNHDSETAFDAVKGNVYVNNPRIRKTVAEIVESLNGENIFFDLKYESVAPIPLQRSELAQIESQK